MTSREGLATAVATVSLVGSVLYAGRAIGRMETRFMVVTEEVQTLQAEVAQARDRAHSMELWVRDAFIEHMKEPRR